MTISALAVDRFELAHLRRREADHVEGSDEVDPDHFLEVGQRLGAIAADHALGDADAGAIDEHPRGPMRRGGFGDRRSDGGFIRDVACDREAADRLGRLFRRGRIEVEDRDLRCLGGERLRRRAAKSRAAAGHDRRNSGEFHCASSLGPSGLEPPISTAERFAPAAADACVCAQLSLMKSLPPSTFTG